MYATGTALIDAGAPGEAVDKEDDFDPAEFRPDLRVIEAAYPIAKLMCDTSDGCGATCSGSACNSSAHNPY